MELNKSLRKLRKLFAQYAPVGAVMLDFKQYENEYIVLCQKNDENCVHYAVLIVTDRGYCECRYYLNILAAWIAFDEIKGRI